MLQELGSQSNQLNLKRGAAQGFRQRPRQMEWGGQRIWGPGQLGCLKPFRCKPRAACLKLRERPVFFWQYLGEEKQREKHTSSG